jgi:hypothetical protein
MTPGRTRIKGDAGGRRSARGGGPPSLGGRLGREI